MSARRRPGVRGDPAAHRGARQRAGRHYTVRLVALRRGGRARCLRRDASYADVLPVSTWGIRQAVDAMLEQSPPPAAAGATRGRRLLPGPNPGFGVGVVPACARPDLGELHLSSPAATCETRSCATSSAVDGSTFRVPAFAVEEPAPPPLGLLGARRSAGSRGRGTAELTVRMEQQGRGRHPQRQHRVLRRGDVEADPRRILIVAVPFALRPVALTASVAAAKVWRAQIRGGGENLLRGRSPASAFAPEVSTPSDLSDQLPGARCQGRCPATRTRCPIRRSSARWPSPSTARPGRRRWAPLHQALTRPSTTAVRVTIAIQGPNTVDIRSVTIGYYVP